MIRLYLPSMALSIAILYIMPYLIAYYEGKIISLKDLPSEIFWAVIFGMFWPISIFFLPLQLTREFSDD